MHMKGEPMAGKENREIKNSIRKKELFYKTIHAKTVVVLYRVILREFLRPAKLPVSFTERISVSRLTIAYLSFKNNNIFHFTIKKHLHEVKSLFPL